MPVFAERTVVTLLEHRPIDPVVIAWQAAGGVPGSATLQAQSQMVKRWRRGGYFSKVAHFNMMCGLTLASALVPLIKGNAPGNAVNNNFVAGNYSEAGGLLGDGATKWLDIGATITTLLGGIATGALGAYQCTAMSAGTKVSIGCIALSNGYRIRQTTGRWGLTTDTNVLGSPLALGWSQINRASSTDLALYSNGVSVASSATPTIPAEPGVNLYVFAANSAGTPANFCDGAFGGYAVCQTMTAAEALDFAQSVRACAAALGRPG